MEKQIKGITDSEQKKYIKDFESAIKALRENDNLNLDKYKPFIREFYSFSDDWFE